MYYLNYFFIFSILGHFIETFFYTNGESGILLGYWTPIYGIGIITMLLIDKFLKKFQINKFIKGFLLFLLNAITLASMEVVGGHLIKQIFNKEMWSYTNHKFNIGKYTSLEMALIWGICSIIFIYLINPIIDKVITKIPKCLTYILVILFIIDIMATLIIKI